MFKDENEYLAQEMRDVSLGSFPLSPGVMTGHYAISNLYCYWRQDTLQDKTPAQIFGTNDPPAPKLTIPDGHFSLTSTSGLNNVVWNNLLQTAFSPRPHHTNPQDEVRDIISVLAESDKKNFHKRLTGLKSRLFGTKPAPSLLRSFAFEDKFPIKNDFFFWLIPQMAQEVRMAAENDFQPEWSWTINGLVLMWNSKFPDDPFIP